MMGRSIYTIAAVFGRPRGTGVTSALFGMLGATDATPHTQVRAGAGGGVASTFVPETSGCEGAHVAVAHRSDLTVAADANLCYRADLLRELASAGLSIPRGHVSDAELILGAYEAWGNDCPSRLEGDFAFAVWDEGRGKGFAAVDFAAGRTLFYASLGQSLALGSSLQVVASHPGTDQRLNLAHVGEIAAGMWAGGDETCYSGIRRLLAGHSLEWTGGGDFRTWAHWELPHRDDGPEQSFEQAAVVLRDLLVQATGERLNRTGSTTVWMSGGWDSTAVFAAGQEWLRRSGESDGDLLRPVSMSYPEGDPGREDDWIIEVSRHWGVTPHWVHSTDVPVLHNPSEGARRRDEAWAHPLEHWNRALARATRELGASVALTGNGGDQLFAGPVGRFSDLFWSGRWWTLRREWIERRGRGARTFLRAAVLPGLPRAAYDLARVLRGGRRPRHHLDRRPPPWFNPSFVREARLLERQWDERRWPWPGRAAHGEMEFYFKTAYAARVSASVRGFALDEGVALAAPLLDRRVVEFAATRPPAERSSGLESKRLLRAAMRGLMPDTVLASRPMKTGLTVAFFDQKLRAALGPVVRDLGKGMILDELGVIDEGSFRRAANDYICSSDRSRLGLGIYLTLQTDLWLRAHVTERATTLAGERGTEPAIFDLAVVGKG